MNRLLSGEDFDYQCHSNLVRAVLPYGLTESDVHDVLNVFQVTGLNRDGKYFMFVPHPPRYRPFLIAETGNRPQQNLQITSRTSQKPISCAQCRRALVGICQLMGGATIQRSACWILVDRLVWRFMRLRGKRRCWEVGRRVRGRDIEGCMG